MIKLHYYPSSVSLLSRDSSSPPPSSPAFLSHTTGDDDSGDEIDNSGVESEIEKERWCFGLLGFSLSRILLGLLRLVSLGWSRRWSSSRRRSPCLDSSRGSPFGLLSLDSSRRWLCSFLRRFKSKGKAVVLLFTHVSDYDWCLLY